jgi:hypothetical protein
VDAQAPMSPAVVLADAFQYNATALALTRVARATHTIHVYPAEHVALHLVTQARLTTRGETDE